MLVAWQKRNMHETNGHNANKWYISYTRCIRPWVIVLAVIPLKRAFETVRVCCGVEEVDVLGMVVVEVVIHGNESESSDVWDIVRNLIFTGSSRVDGSGTHVISVLVGPRGTCEKYQGRCLTVRVLAPRSCQSKTKRDKRAFGGQQQGRAVREQRQKMPGKSTRGCACPEAEEAATLQGEEELMKTTAAGSSGEMRGWIQVRLSGSATEGPMASKMQKGRGRRSLRKMEGGGAETEPCGGRPVAKAGCAVAKLRASMVASMAGSRAGRTR
ncbi:hypothetical protein TRIUR3_15920 [Triticum urartu]|uniref:Uncharacterized protein n=1 Tax=Triticum urartu TaxID=4572 RepID=M7ZCM0_TRIUA|nr:hypothetical protein TRIUR3_15920 [Triticum urartu]